MPKRFVTDEFRKKRSCIIIAVTAAVFGIAMFIISQVLNDHYFMIMAAQLLAEYSLLVVMIMLSLIVRLKGDVVKSGIRLYTPIMFVGLLVFVYRIVFMPTIAINLTLPPILLLCAIWQLVVITRRNRLMPRSDMFYTWFSFAVLLVATVMSWVGYTLMAVQLLIWWVMQLTMIQTITVFYDLLHRYQKRHIADDADIRSTWFYDMIYKMIVPIVATFSVILTIYWAAKVFNLTEWCLKIYTYNFINLPGIIVASLSKLVAIVALAFVFNYLIYAIVQAYIIWKTEVRGAKRAVSLSMNIMKYIGWGIFAYIAMVVLQVNRAGITLILTGLSTGIGFALKDTLENLFYGVSLMNGRVQIGDIIECDGIRGKVKNINYQSTMVETIDGSVVAFLNSQLFSKNFKNMTQNHGYEKATITVGIAYGAKISRVREIITERLATNVESYNKDKGIQVLFENFGESSVDLTVVIWLPVNTLIVETARVKEEIYNVLNENGIEIPFPQTDLHIKTDAARAILSSMPESEE